MDKNEFMSVLGMRVGTELLWEIGGLTVELDQCLSPDNEFFDPDIYSIGITLDSGESVSTIISMKSIEDAEDVNDKLVTAFCQIIRKRIRERNNGI